MLVGYKNLNTKIDFFVYYSIITIQNTQLAMQTLIEIKNTATFHILLPFFLNEACTSQGGKTPCKIEKF